MDQAEPHSATEPAARGLAAGFATLCAPTMAIALGHMLQTAQRGVICGMSATDGGHCWACYAAPLLALAALACWRFAPSTPRPAYARR